MGLFRRNKNNNKPVIRQILDLVPRRIFDNCTKTNKSAKITNQPILLDNKLFWKSALAIFWP